MKKEGKQIVFLLLVISFSFILTIISSSFILADSVDRTFNYPNNALFPKMVYTNSNLTVFYNRISAANNYWIVDQYIPAGWNVSGENINTSRLRFFTNLANKTYLFLAPSIAGMYVFNDSTYWNYGNNDTWYPFINETINVTACTPVAETCDNKDNDCDYQIDDGVKLTFYRDFDADGFGNASVSFQNCSAPAGYVLNNADCNDNSAIEKPDQIWYKDTDKDRYSDGTSQVSCSRPAGYNLSTELLATSGDCNDNNASIKPGAVEVCNYVDDNCAGGIDEGVKLTFYRDFDADGFGNLTNTYQNCTITTGYVTNNTDCNDNNIVEKPGQIWYKDTDKDRYSDGTSQVSCSRPANYNISTELLATSGDCNDTNNKEFPGQQWYKDFDGDRYSDGTLNVTCSRPVKYNISTELLATSGDCNDTNILISPGATEICNGLDDNCNLQTDEAFDNESCSFVCAASGFNYNSSKAGNLRCCGNDPLEDSPFQLKETFCTDLRDNDCDGIIDGPKNTGADTDCSLCVSSIEFGNYLTKWVDGIVDSTNFTQAATTWINGACF